MGIILAAKAAIPPEDEDPITANKYKFYIKVMSRYRMNFPSTTIRYQWKV
jgi:hypothetical protein